MRPAHHVCVCLSARAVQVLLTYIGLTGRERLAFRDLHSKALREAEMAFARCEA